MTPCGCTQNVICKQRKLQTNDAHLICRSPKFDYINDFLSFVLVLYTGLLSNPMFSTKLVLSRFGLLGNLNHYDIPLLYTPSRQLRSSADTWLLRLLSSHLKSCGQRAAFHQAPLLWNNPPTPFETFLPYHHLFLPHNPSFLL